MVVWTLLLFSSMSAYQNPQKKVLGTVASGMALSEDGSTIVVTYVFRKKADILIQTKKGFIFEQSLVGTVQSFGVVMGSSKSVVINQGKHYLKCFKPDEDGLYQLDQTIFSPDRIEDMALCPAEQYLAFATRSNEQHLHQNNANVFSHLKTYNCPSGYASFITFSQDCSWLAYICTNKQVILYKNIDAFTFIQKMTFPNVPSNVKIGGVDMLVTCQSAAGFNETTSYRYNGSQFISTTVIPKINLTQISATPKFTKFAAALNQQTFIVYSQNNRSISL